MSPHIERHGADPVNAEPGRATGVLSLVSVPRESCGHFAYPDDRQGVRQQRKGGSLNQLLRPVGIHDHHAVAALAD